MVDVCGLDTQEMKVGESRIQSHPQLHIEVQANLFLMRSYPSLKKKKMRTKEQNVFTKSLPSISTGQWAQPSATILEVLCKETLISWPPESSQFNNCFP